MHVGTCEVGDSKSVCSAVDSTVEISFWEELDRDVIRYVLLLFQNFVVDDFRYPAKYWGFTPFETTAELKLKGITPGEILEESWAKRFAAKLKEGMNLDAKNINIPGFQILISQVDSAVVSKRSLRVLQSQMQRGLFADSSTVTVTVAGQYNAPPLINEFGEIVDGSIDRLVAPERVDSTFDDTLGTGVEILTDEKATSGTNGVGDKATDGENQLSTDKKGGNELNDDEFGFPKKGNSVKMGTIFGILFAVLAVLMFLTLMILFVNRKRKENVMYMKDKEFNSYDPNTEYEEGGDFYDQYPDRVMSNHDYDLNSRQSYRSRYDEASQYDQSAYDDDDTFNDSFRDTIKTSVITDPTYRGGKFPDSHRYREVDPNEDGYGDTYADSRWGSDQRTYEGEPIQNEAEDEFDDNEDGTFTGLMLKSNEADEVSCLMSVRGVEDAWISTSNRQMRTAQLPTPKPKQHDMMTSVDVSNHVNEPGQESVISAPTMISAPTVLVDRLRPKPRFPMTHTSSQRSVQTGTGSRHSQDVSVSNTYTSAPTIIVDSAKNDGFENLLNFTNDKQLNHDGNDGVRVNGNVPQYNYLRRQPSSNTPESRDNIQGSSKQFVERNGAVLNDESRMIENGIEKENPFDSHYGQHQQHHITNPNRMMISDSAKSSNSFNEAEHKYGNESLRLTNGPTATHQLLPMIDEGEDSEQGEDVIDLPLLGDSNDDRPAKHQIVPRAHEIVTKTHYSDRQSSQASNLIEYSQDTEADNNKIVSHNAVQGGGKTRALLELEDSTEDAPVQHQIVLQAHEIVPKMHYADNQSSDSNEIVSRRTADLRSDLLEAGDDAPVQHEIVPRAHEIVTKTHYSDRQSSQGSNMIEYSLDTGADNKKIVSSNGVQGGGKTRALLELEDSTEDAPVQHEIVSQAYEIVPKMHYSDRQSSQASNMIEYNQGIEESTNNEIVSRGTADLTSDLQEAWDDAPVQHEIVPQAHEIVTKMHYSDRQSSQGSNMIEYNQGIEESTNNEIVSRGTADLTSDLLEAWDDAPGQHEIVPQAHEIVPKAHNDSQNNNKFNIKETQEDPRTHDDPLQQQIVPQTHEPMTKTRSNRQSLASSYSKMISRRSKRMSKDTKAVLEAGDDVRLHNEIVVGERRNEVKHHRVGKMIEQDGNAEISVCGIDSSNVPAAIDLKVDNRRNFSEKVAMPEQHERNALPLKALECDNSIGEVEFAIDTSKKLLSDKAIKDQKEFVSNAVIQRNSSFKDESIPHDTIHEAHKKPTMEFVNHAENLNRNAMVLTREDSNSSDVHTTDGRTVLTID